ncbi:MAG: hypothetical protein N3D11_00235 [Candidatus Sumerlaeia bacterium]|nr:hypothetical protein [Candidatus Sumerlaeia bacterium]
MKRWIATASLAMGLLAAGAPSRAADPVPFSLAKVQITDWVRQGDIQKVVGEKLYDLIDGFADIHMGFAYVDSEHMKLTKGKQEFEVAVYRLSNSDNAYGLYSALRQRDGEIIAIPDEASYSPGMVVLWRGSYCIEVKDVGEEGAAKENLIAVAKTIAQEIPGQHPLPELVRALPKEKLRANGILYIHDRHPLDQIWFMGTDNILLLEANANKPAKAEAVYAGYDLSGGEQGILVARYVAPEDSAKALAQFTESVKKDMASIANESPWHTFTAKNGKKTLVFQKDRLLILGLESDQAEVVRGIIEKIAKALEPKKDKDKAVAAKK